MWSQAAESQEEHRIAASSLDRGAQLQLSGTIPTAFVRLRPHAHGLAALHFAVYTVLMLPKTVKALAAAQS